MTLEPQLNLGWVLFYGRRYDESIAQLKRVLELDPKNVGAWAQLVWNYRAKGMSTEVREASKHVAALAPPGEPLLEMSISSELRAAGVEENGRPGYVDQYNVALVQAGEGKIDEAFASLEKAFVQRSVNLYTMKIDPMMDPLRKDPRFAQYVARLKLPP
jgi:tetratricopeptide (TPR) repeat protein